MGYDADAGKSQAQRGRPPDAGELYPGLASTRSEFLDLPTVTIPADPGQCATYDPSRQPQVQIPCVQIGDGVYAAGFNQVAAPAGGLRFDPEPGSVQLANTIPTENCAALTLDVINRLYIGCSASAPSFGLSAAWTAP